MAWYGTPGAAKAWYGTRGSAKPEGYDSRCPEYGAWKNIRHRIDNPKNAWYHRYGGRGITLCDRWRGPMGFIHFVVDLGPRPSREHSLDRRDNGEGYTPENCRWATRAEQNANRAVRVGEARTERQRNADKVHSGRNGPTMVFEDKTLREWAAVLGIGYAAFKVRYRKYRQDRLTYTQLMEPPAVGRRRGMENRTKAERV